jgi:2-C-methyl-D-erythritol 4-phosphate cytidylyltransferase/2-C-methyl-D-erythritol 2,4-cyclodiphosphate synthase
MSFCAAIVVAAGRGARFGGRTPKQYVNLGGYPLLRHSLTVFAKHPRIDAVIPVIRPDDRDLFLHAASGLDIREPVSGGASRQDSVYRGLEALENENPGKILIHDGARPKPGSGVIDRVLDALDGAAAGVIPVLAVPDTLKRIDGANIVRETVARDGVVRAQTPQAFLFKPLIAAHRACAGKSLTDDAAVIEHCGHEVTTVEGDPGNIKVTDNADLEAVAKSLFETRTGSGFDAHRFGDGNGLMLGGINIPFDKSLLGHSDADVVLHAATDAVLGALADGDIGIHFPPSEPAHKDAPSDIFLRFAISRLQQRLGRLLHLDLTVICEQPKLSVHRDAMRARIAEISDVSLDRVSVKATTTEGLGFTGRGEGIACQAVATIQIVP